MERESEGSYCRKESLLALPSALKSSSIATGLFLESETLLSSLLNRLSKVTAEDSLRDFRRFMIEPYAELLWPIYMFCLALSV